MNRDDRAHGALLILNELVRISSMEGEVSARHSEDGPSFCSLSLSLVSFLTADARGHGGNHTAAAGARQVLQGADGLWDQTASHYALHQLPVGAAAAVQRLAGPAGLQHPAGFLYLWCDAGAGQDLAGGESILPGADGGAI